MVKSGSRLRRKVEKRARTDCEEASTSGFDAEGPAPPPHLRRKVARQMQFMDRLVATSKLLAARTSLQKKRRRKAASGGRIDVSSLAAGLSDAELEVGKAKGRRRKGLGAGGARARRRISTQETIRLQQVLAHPKFQADPVAAITNHLQATLPPPEPVKARPANINGSQKRRQKQLKAKLAAGQN